MEQAFKNQQQTTQSSDISFIATLLLRINDSISQQNKKMLEKNKYKNQKKNEEN